MVGCPYKTNSQNGADPVAKSVVVGKSTSSGVNQGQSLPLSDFEQVHYQIVLPV